MWQGNKPHGTRNIDKIERLAVELQQKAISTTQNKGSMDKYFLCQYRYMENINQYRSRFFMY